MSDPVADLPLLGTLPAGERTVYPPPGADAGLHFIGRILTPWADPMACPKRGDRKDGPDCRIEIVPLWRPLMTGVAALPLLQAICRLHLGRRDVALQSPRNDGALRGIFALRSPMRPNPLGVSTVRLIGVDDTGLAVRGLDCVSGAPLPDVKPDTSIWAPVACR